MKNILKRNVIQYLGIVVGSVFFAMSYSWFLIPYKIAPGGIGGLAQIFFHFFGLPVGVSMIVMNIPLFILSFLVLGKGFGIRSFYGMLIVSVVTDLFSLTNLHKFGFIDDLAKYTHVINGETIYAMLGPEDIYLSAIAGSVLLGLGLGIIFRFKGSTGGTDIPVAIIREKSGVSIGTGYWVVETFIILIVGLVFRDLKLIIWGYVNLFITSKITDIASEGLPYTKGVYIVSEYSADIRAEIYNHLNRGVTFLKAEGGYSGKPVDVIFCVVNRRQVSVMRDIVKDIDPKAFMVVSDVNDVMGYGFKSRKLELRDQKK
ncbi:MAG: YitT family protein [Candidatus Cloacimonetes bacterium]|nr:YitT family protein [Candidatus Cloacimonadota bacterium]